MCNWGEDVELLIPVDARDSHTGEARWARKKVDRCIAPLVKALNDAGAYTRTSCCGHWTKQGEIRLQDGTSILVKPSRGNHIDDLVALLREAYPKSDAGDALRYLTGPTNQQESDDE